MAMTKKEKAEFDAAINRANMLAALRWTEPVARDLPIPEKYQQPTRGWDFNPYTRLIEQKWSSIGRHGCGAPDNNRSAIKGGKELFSSRLLALKALRHAIEIQASESLLKIDKQIAEEKLMRIDDHISDGLAKAGK